MIIYIYLNRIEVSPDDLEDELIMDDSLTPMERIYMFNKSDMIIHRYRKGWRESKKKESIGRGNERGENLFFFIIRLFSIS